MITLDLYRPYVDQIESIVLNLLGSNYVTGYDTEVSNILNGQPSQVIRTLVPLGQLRKSGIFFTNHLLADKLIEPLRGDIESGSTITDPTCGVGNLLIACAKLLPVEGDINSTLQLWGAKLKGFDLHSELVRAAKIRLVLLAIHRGAVSNKKISSLDHFFPHICAADGLSNGLDAKCIVINPPYGMVDAPKQCTWASGRVSHAAVFLEKCVKEVLPDTKIIALLPDVLRTGTRYSRWRELIGSYAEILSIEIVGQFDRVTDVDVFILRLIKRSLPRIEKCWWNTGGKELQSKPIRTVGDIFNVHIGSVVPHRNPKKGRWYPYIHAKLLPPWTTIDIDSGFSKIRFGGTTFDPPFIVVRRTSRPGDKFRATATLIIGEKPAAVENHLIVLQPRNGTLEVCEQLLGLLKSACVTNWLDNRIRCRHLTISSISELPWKLC